jgi:hypothetical protein
MKARARARGLFERPPGSGVWWINYYVNGKQHREKAGRRGDALALYQKRKADARRKLKLPELVPGRVVTFGHLSDMAVNHAETHLKSIEHYKTKDSILREPFGERPAAGITLQEISDWLTKHCKTPATPSFRLTWLMFQSSDCSSDGSGGRLNSYGLSSYGSLQRPRNADHERISN